MPLPGPGPDELHAQATLVVADAVRVERLTGARAWSTSVLRDHAHRHHRAWPPDPHPPAWVPAGVRTVPALRVPAGPGWQAATASVMPASAERFHWPPLTTGGAAGFRRAA